jgi:hypothetical protein
LRDSRERARRACDSPALDRQLRRGSCTIPALRAVARNASRSAWP